MFGSGTNTVAGQLKPVFNTGLDSRDQNVNISLALNRERNLMTQGDGRVAVALLPADCLVTPHLSPSVRGRAPS